MPDKDVNTSEIKASNEGDAVDVSMLPTNRNQNPDINSRGRGPIIINDPEATSLNRGIFDNENREYYDGDLYR
ncbi:hypothetical protein JOC77_002207 [Peribacillus deserti]|uniref:Uncharacterized protein n=1 Tax=Peribacillus deserti TaxID=673318 RepID=A0ABS2QHX7_9BACI|nr:hypothetical protein [Peribacillus deserti]MBM7692776.1 hypothetical protein [Peribacillus deserti]